MIYVLTPAQMRAADAAAIAARGEDALMREAGRQVARTLRELDARARRVVAFAGPGNNGGDAFAALAELAADFECVVHADRRRESPRGRARRRRSGARAAGVEVRPLPDGDDAARAALDGAVAVDALFGTGARLPIARPYRSLRTRARRARTARASRSTFPAASMR